MTTRKNPHPYRTPLNRRRFLQLFAGAGAALASPLAAAGTVLRPERRLTLFNTHTGERISALYWADGDYLPESLAEISHVLRDHRSNKTHAIDPRLLDLLFELQCKVDNHRELHVISGYRSPETNAMLRASSGGVARRSLHMEGKAIDINLPGCELRDLHKAALALRSGGVGYYPRSGFIHVDTGRVRSW